MSLASRWHYYRRISSAYLGSGRSHLTFWHEVPEINPRAFEHEETNAPARHAKPGLINGLAVEKGNPQGLKPALLATVGDTPPPQNANSGRSEGPGEAVPFPGPVGESRSSQLGEYYMRFREKADHAGPYDSVGIPMLDYRGAIGLQHNPIAIAQWGLANYNLFCETNEGTRWQKALKAADWLCANLEQNSHGVWVWNHHFDWEYRDTLRAPWYSGLAQGQGLSLLVRVHAYTGDDRYRSAAEQAFVALTRHGAEGGVLWDDDDHNLWIEEYLVDPPTHILNGFIWALWGVFDYWQASVVPVAKDIFDGGTRTLLHNLPRYDTGYWSLYEQSGTRLKMLASPFYHRLHIVQLRVMARLTGEKLFADFADRWEGYTKRLGNRMLALVEKSAFKLLYY